MAEITKFPGFTASDRPSLGVAMIFDISGFTNFLNKPDIHFYAPRYINHIIECVEACIYGGRDYWTGATDDLSPLPLLPIFRKFLGDGMLYIWENNDENAFANTDIKIDLVNMLWNLQKFFDKVNRKLYTKIPLGDLPPKIKFGIAQGTIYRLTEPDGSQDFIGPCINLASRLVKYCPEINFICSGRLDINDEDLIDFGYLRIFAKELRSFENDQVIIDKNDYAKVSQEDKKRLFKEILV